MGFNENIYDRIQKYLDGELTGTEREGFETELEANSELSQETELNRQMKDFLADTGENELRRNLQILNDRVTTDPTSSGFSAKRFLWLIPLFLIAGWLFLTNGNSNNEPAAEEPIEENTTQNLSEESQTEVIDSLKTTDILEEVSKNKTELKTEIKEVKKTNQKKTKPSVPQSSPSKKPEPKKEIPIAGTEAEEPTIIEEMSSIQPVYAAEFEPNPQLEILVSNNVRNNDFEWEIEQRQGNYQIKDKTGTVQFQFKAVLKSNQNLEGKTFKIHLFSNDKKQFDDFNPLSSEDLTLNKTDEGTYRIDYQKKLNLKLGLYYYLIEEFDIEKVYFADKFLVEN